MKKVYYKVSLCEYRQLQSCKAFIGLSTRAKMVRVGRSLLRRNLAEIDLPSLKRRFPINIRSFASAVTSSEKSSIGTNTKSTMSFS